MKTKILLKALTAALFLSGFSAVAAGLTPTVASAVLFMKQEEKLARDVYLALYAEWGHTTFQNIAVAEQKHMDAVNNLIARYQLKDTTPAAPGKFTYPELQDLYQKLVADGATSLGLALEVGVTIEETDIEDLETSLDLRLPTDVRRVFSNLLNGSMNHLAAFERALAALETPCACPMAPDSTNCKL